MPRPKRIGATEAPKTIGKEEPERSGQGPDIFFLSRDMPILDEALSSSAAFTLRHSVGHHHFVHPGSPFLPVSWQQSRCFGQVATGAMRVSLLIPASWRPFFRWLLLISKRNRFNPLSEQSWFLPLRRLPRFPPDRESDQHLRDSGFPLYYAAASSYSGTSSTSISRRSICS